MTQDRESRRAMKQDREFRRGFQAHFVLMGVLLAGLIIIGLITWLT